MTETDHNFVRRMRNHYRYTIQKYEGHKTSFLINKKSPHGFYSNRFWATDFIKPTLISLTKADPKRIALATDSTEGTLNQKLRRDTKTRPSMKPAAVESNSQLLQCNNSSASVGIAQALKGDVPKGLEEFFHGTAIKPTLNHDLVSLTIAMWTYSKILQCHNSGNISTTHLHMCVNFLSLDYIFALIFSTCPFRLLPCVIPRTDSQSPTTGIRYPWWSKWLNVVNNAE